MIDVPDVQLDPLRPGQSVASLDLRVARHTGSDLEPPSLGRVIVHDLLGQRRAGPDEAHVAGEHVPQLRELVEARRPQQPADRRGAVEVRLAKMGRWAHRAELGDREGYPVAASADLVEQDGPAELCPDEQGDDQQDRCADDQADRCDDDVDSPPHGSIPRSHATAA